MLPFLIAAAAAVGLGAHVYAYAENSEAREKNRQANEIIEEATARAQTAKESCQNSMDALAKEKAEILHGNMRRFVKNFSKIKDVNFSDSKDLFEAANFNRNELVSMETMVSNVRKVSINDIAGTVSGAVLAVGAANALTGGSLLGAAAGRMVGSALVGAVAAPVFAITGIFSAAEASANLDKAKSNLAKARAFEDKCDTYVYFANAVSERCDLFYQTLYNVDEAWFTGAVDQLELLVDSKKTFVNFVKNIFKIKIYTREEMQLVASAASMAKMMKTIIDTNILDSNGELTKESKKVIQTVNHRIKTGDMPVAMLPQGRR